MRRIIEPICRMLADEMPELNFVDINLEHLQLENPPVDFPCALVDVEDVRFRSATGCQLGDASVTVTFGFRIFAPSDVNSPQELREMGLQHYDIVRRAAALLHGFSTSEFTPLIRTDYRRGTQSYPRTITLCFTTQIKDPAGKSYSHVPAEPIIEVEIQQ